MLDSGLFSFGGFPEGSQLTTSLASPSLFGSTPMTSSNDIASPTQLTTSASLDATSGAPNGQATAGLFSTIQKASPLIKSGPAVSSTVKETSPSTTFKGFGPPSSGPVALKSTFSFGQSTPASPSPQSTFGFGQSTPASPMPPAFGFGQSNPASSMPQSTFGFSQSTSATPAPQPTFGFYQSTSASPAPQPTLAFGQFILASPIAQSVSSSIQANPPLSSPETINTATESGSKSGAGNGEASLSHPATGLNAGATKRQREKETAQAPEDLRSAQLQLGNMNFKLDKNKSEIVEGLLMYLYTYDFPKFATVGDASIAMQLGDLYSVPRFARNAKMQVLESVKNFGQVGNEDIAAWVRNFELWWGLQQTAVTDIKTQVFERIRTNAEQFIWSAAFMDLLGRNKDLRVDVFKIFATHKTSDAVENAATDVGDQFKLKAKELNGKIKQKQAEIDAAVAESRALQDKLKLVEGNEDDDVDYDFIDYRYM